MLHPTLASRYASERKIFLRLLRLAFSFAGLFWFLLYASPANAHVQLRSDQTIIYFILLSLWGLDYMREQKRLGVVITAANELRVTPDLVTLDDVSAKASLFAMLRPRGNRNGAIMPALFGAGLIAGWVLIVRQYINVIAILAE